MFIISTDWNVLFTDEIPKHQSECLLYNMVKWYFFLESQSGFQTSEMHGLCPEFNENLTKTNKQTKHTTTRVYCIYTHERVNVVSLNGLTAAEQGWMARETSWELRPWCYSIFVPEQITHSLTYSLWHTKDHLTSSNQAKDQVLHCALFSEENINIGRREYHQILFKATTEKLACPYFQTQAIQI